MCAKNVGRNDDRPRRLPQIVSLALAVELQRDGGATDGDDGCAVDLVSCAHRLAVNDRRRMHAGVDDPIEAKVRHRLLLRRRYIGRGRTSRYCRR